MEYEKLKEIHDELKGYSNYQNYEKVRHKYNNAINNDAEINLKMSNGKMQVKLEGNHDTILLCITTLFKEMYKVKNGKTDIIKELLFLDSCFDTIEKFYKNILGDNMVEELSKKSTEEQDVIIQLMMNKIRNNQK